jgi:signal transduction histidine kinase
MMNEQYAEPIDLDAANSVEWISKQSVKKQFKNELAKLKPDIKNDVRRLRLELVVAAEKERRDVAADLHDSLGQRLFAWQLRVGMALKNTEPDSVQEFLVPVASEISDTIRELRTFVYELSPPGLLELGLSGTLKNLTRHTNSLSSLQVTFSEQGEPHQLPATTSSILYRSVNELICNATRHSSGTQLTVSISWEPQRIQITVADDGKGFDRGVMLCPVGLGLFSIRERLQALEGQLSIITAPDKGLTAVLDVPTKEVE